jgi:hypothetical protein
MNYQDLRNALAPSSGVLTIARDALGAGLTDVIDRCYQGQSIVISSATLAPSGGNGASEVVVTGRASFLQVADLPVTARFSLDSEGKVRAVLKYQLRDGTPGPAAWTFTRSFPQLPGEIFNEGLFQTNVGENVVRKPYVESLDLFDSSYAVATHAGADPEAGVPLEPGLNFVSKMRSQGAVGILEYTMSGGQTPTIYGPIRIPLQTDQTQPLAPLQRAWERPDAPGLHLKAALDVDFKVGGLALSQAALRIYSPPSKDWQSQNATFYPRHGYSGRLAIPSAGIEVELSSELEWGLPRTFLLARCQGVSLKKLTQLVDLVGDSDLAAAMPKELQSALGTLEKLELMEVGLKVALVGTRPLVSEILVTVGMPRLEWKVWDDHLKVKDIACRFQINVSTRKLETTVMGTLEIEGVPLSVIASSGDGFSVYAKLEKAQQIPLKALLDKYAPGLPPPSDLAVNSLAVSIIPGTSYSMFTTLVGAPKPWTIPVGRSDLKLSGVTLNFTVPKGGKATGAISATASMGKTLSLSVRAATPGDLVLRGSFNNIRLRQLIDELCDEAGALPDDFDLTFETASLLVQKRGSDYVAQVAAALAGVGTFAFEVRRTSGKWGFAGGLSLSAGTPAKLPGLSALATIERALRLQRFLLVFSTFDDVQFVFPDMARFNAPAVATGNIALPSGTSGVAAGVNVFAQWAFDTNDKQQNLLKSLLGLEGTVDATIQVGKNPAANTRLFLGRRGKLQGLPFDYKLGLQLTNGSTSFFLTGTLTAKIQGQPQTFDVTTAFVTGGAFMSATMKGATTVDCGPFKLSNLALQIGVNWGGIPSLGIAATIDVKNFSSSVALFFDSTDPSRSLVAGSISNINAREVLNAFAGGLQTPLDEVLKGIAIRGTHEFSIPGDLTDELDGLVCDKVSTAFAGAKVTIPSSSQQLSIVPKSRGTSWHLTDLATMRHYQLEKQGDRIQVQVAPQFYFAPQPTFIGTIKFPQAFYLNAAIAFAGFDAAATVDISPNKGLSIQAQMDKIVILDEKVFSIAALQGGGGPKISVSTFNQPDRPEAEFRLPHFYVNGSLTMLGVKKGVYAKVTTQGIEFELVGQLVPGVNFDLDARFGKAGIGANGTARVGVGTVDLGALGKAKVNTQLEVEVDIDIDTPGRSVSTGKNASWSQEATLLSNELATLVFQGDGNLVLYDTTGTSWKPIWASNTSGRGGTQLAFQGDGNLVIYTGNGTPIWASNTNNKGATKLTLRDDGNLVITDDPGNAKWATGTVVGGGASIELESSFDFAGQHIDLGRFKLQVSSDTFTKLPDIMAKKVEEALRDVFKDATKWANAVKGGVMDGVNDTAKVFQDVYKKSEKEAKALANDMNKGVNQATQAVTNVANDVGKAASKTTKKVIKKAKFW